MKNGRIKLVALALAGCVGISNGMAVQAGFNDMYSSASWDWAVDHIDWAELYGIVAGKANKCFDADASVTRAEAATMMVNFMEIDAEAYDTVCEQFEDVGEEWYTPYVNTAYQNEIVGGKREGIFAPDEEVTRAEIVTMLHSTMKDNYELDDCLGFFVSDGTSYYKFTNAEGRYFYFGDVYGEVDRYGYGGDLILLDDIAGIAGKSMYLRDLAAQGSEYFTYETSSKEIPYVFFTGMNALINISGSNIDKVQVYKDGTVCLYGTGMDYTVEATNMADTLEYVATDSGDVVLKVVDGQWTVINAPQGEE